MRFVIALCFVLLGAAAFISRPALGAPGCYYPNGDWAMNCSAPGAMPQGWQPSPEQLRQWQQARPHDPDTETIMGTFLGLAALLALIALMPRFDGSRSEDWLPERKKRR